MKRSILNWITAVFPRATGNAETESVDTTLSREQGDLEFAQGNYAAAVEHYQHALGGMPAKVETLRNLGVAFKALGRYGEAAIALHRALELDPASAEIQYFLGDVANTQGVTEDAVKHWRKAIDLAPDFEPAYLGLCYTLLQTGQPELAQRVAEDGILHLPQSVELPFWSGNLYQATGQFDQAERAYLQALGKRPDRADILANFGLLLARQDRFEQAIDVLQQSLAIDPNHAVVHLNLADALFGLERWSEAFGRLEHAVAKDPAHAESWNDWGLRLHASHDLEKAIFCFEQYLKSNPSHAPTLLNLANLHHAAHQWQAAEQKYQELLRLDPQRTDVLYNLGVNYSARDDEENATACFRRVLFLQPDHVDANIALGASLHLRGKYEEAIACYLKALANHPEQIETRLRLANAWRACERWTEANEEYMHILRTAPGDLNTLINFGIALQSQENYEGAMARYRHALTIAPGNHDVLINLGAVFEAKGEFSDALDCYEKALLADSVSLPAHINMASVLTLQGRLKDAVDLCDRALKIDASNPDANYSRGLSLLRLGEYKEGWKGYAYRWTRTDAPSKPMHSAKEWDGTDSLQGKTILLYTEQGLGDTIQFVRYVEMVAAAGAKIILEVQAPLLPLFEKMEYVDQIVVQGQADTLSAIDYQCALLDLPAVFKSDLASLPKRIPYLYAKAERIADWKSRLARTESPKIGLVWAGNPLHKNDKNRSTALSDLQPLWSDKNRRFLSLQKDIPAKDADALKKNESILDLSAFLTDFTETAAILSCLDLLITVDSSLAHLAGAMGVPVWIMLPWLPDFRWLMDRTDSPWYPSAKLFRQNSAGNWASVADAIDAALDEQFKSTGIK